MRECRECGISKTMSEYRRNKLGKDGYLTKCRECENERARYRKEMKRKFGQDFTNYDLIPSGHSKCSVCKKVKSLELFHKNKQRSGGYCSRCKECNAQYMSDWRNSNIEKTLKYSRKWKVENRDRKLALDRSYRERNKDRIRVSEQNRLARKMKLPDTLTDVDLDEIHATFEGICAISGDVAESLDHFIPLSIGHGGTTKQNIIPLSTPINSSKQARNPFEWAKTYLTEQQRSNFNKVIEYLAELNGLTVDEYREFVFWCFENKREAHEITDDNRDSLALWLRTKKNAA